MDKIQELLIKAGRKDLAQEYYKKIARRKDDIIKIVKTIDGDEKTLVDYELYTGASAPNKFFYMIPLPNKDVSKFEDELEKAVKDIFDKYKKIFPGE
jgi:hypothetical protein